MQGSNVAALPMMSEVGQARTWGRVDSGWVGMRQRSQGSDNVAVVDLGTDHMAIFTLQKSVGLYTYYLCTFPLCVNKKYTEIKIAQNQSHPKVS